jgi:NAD+ diphosphatase
MVLEIDVPPDPNELTPFSLREAHVHIGTDLWTIAGRASQILRWRRDHQFCGRCGTEMQEEPQESLRKCPKCGFFTYPRISPAVIMSIVKEDKILLGRSPRFPTGMYSVLAGFVEPGETLEEAVAREVKEETNIDITDIRYIASQPWPFPHSLMVGFTARYAGGTIKVDNDELEDAAWFSAAELPRLPTPISIARKLIDLHLRDIAG